MKAPEKSSFFQKTYRWVSFYARTRKGLTSLEDVKKYLLFYKTSRKCRYSVSYRPLKWFLSVEERVKSWLIETTSKRSSSFRRPIKAVVSLEGLQVFFLQNTLKSLMFLESLESADDPKKGFSIENLRQIVGLQNISNISLADPVEILQEIFHLQKT